MNLLGQVNDLLFLKFFDIESEELFDDKIKVIEALISGKRPSEIPKYYEVLELYPGDDVLWDM